MRTLNVAMIGTGFMGKAHALAYAGLPAFYWPPPAMPVRKIVVDRTEALAATGRDRFGFEKFSTDWAAVVQDPQIDIVDICTPNDSHAEIAIAAAAAGKHIMCEKPLARSAPEAKRMLDAVAGKKLTHMVAFNYRHTPAVVFARKLIEERRIGTLLNFHGHYLSDWSADPATPLSWRFQKSVAGSGTIGDIGSHILDMARYLVGEIEAVNAIVQTYIAERPEQTGEFDKLGSAERRPEGPKRPVDVDDEATFLLRFAGGAVGSIDATRNAYGRGNYLGFELHGTAGSIIFNFERMNELQVFFADDPPELRGFRTIMTGPPHPHGEALWPVAGLGVGYLDVKIVECHGLISAIAEGRPASPNFADGYRIALICDAILASGQRRGWVEVGG
jgi:predicted dehydrogenase